jgi:cobalt/nickel transport system ATP-binding protein
MGRKNASPLPGRWYYRPNICCWMNPPPGWIPPGAQMIAIIQRIVAQGNHVVISSHDIDLIYEICDAVYVLRRGEMLAYGTPGEVFAQKRKLNRPG